MVLVISSLVLALALHTARTERDQWRKAAEDNLREGSKPQIASYMNQVELERIEFKLDQLLARPTINISPTPALLFTNPPPISTNKVSWTEWINSPTGAYQATITAGTNDIEYILKFGDEYDKIQAIEKATHWKLDIFKGVFK